MPVTATECLHQMVVKLIATEVCQLAPAHLATSQRYRVIIIQIFKCFSGRQSMATSNKYIIVALMFSKIPWFYSAIILWFHDKVLLPTYNLCVHLHFCFCSLLALQNIKQ